MAPGNSNGAGNQQMMMMVGVMCVCCICMVAIAGGFYMMQNKPASTPAPTPGPQPSTPDEDTPTGGDMAGVKTIKYGGTRLVVPSKAKCNPSGAQAYKVYLNNGSENMQHQWKFIDVPNRPGTYYVRSEQKNFNNGCNLYLTAPQSCNAGNDVGIDKSGYAERQYWKLKPTGDGYQMVSVHCEDSRSNKYLISKGVIGPGKKATDNTMRMSDREGTIYTIEGVQAATD
jgi:hypothetical protein